MNETQRNFMDNFFLKTKFIICLKPMVFCSRAIKKENSETQNLKALNQQKISYH